MRSRPELVLDCYERLDTSGYEPDARRKPFWHRENFGHFLRGHDLLVRPATVEYWPSAMCNSRCPLCPYRRNGARAAADAAEDASEFLATVADAQRAAEECRRLGVRSVLLTGGGEPFAHPAVDRIAAAFVEQGLALGVYSNGTFGGRTEAVARIAALEPRFVRLSVNAGSAEEHDREYGFAGGWQALGETARLWARLLRPQTSLSFSWVLTGREGPKTYAGAAEFLLALHRDTGRAIAAHFRPKFVYFNADGGVRAPEPGAFETIPARVNELVVPALAAEAGVEIQVNSYAVKVARTCRRPQPCFATGWATSLTHRGEGYITSELAGSRWPDTCWGGLERERNGAGASLERLWFGEERLRLARLYAEEARLPVYHKLTGLTHLLRGIREACKEPFSPGEVEAFWREFDARGYTQPPNWDFI